jgi:hypothetical protein
MDCSYGLVTRVEAVEVCGEAAPGDPRGFEFCSTAPPGKVAIACLSPQAAVIFVGITCCARLLFMFAYPFNPENPKPPTAGIIAGMLVLGFCGDIIGRKWGSRLAATIMLLGSIMLTASAGPTASTFLALFSAALFVFGEPHA